jgi:hypothetical protein
MGRRALRSPGAISVVRGQSDRARARVPHRIRLERDSIPPRVKIIDGEIRAGGDPAYLARQVGDYWSPLRAELALREALARAHARGR